MAHPLEERIAQVRRQARRMLVLYALGWTVAIVVGVAVGLSLVDYLLRFQDHGIRLMSSVALVLSLLWACYRFWFLGFARSLSNLAIARRLERRFPQFSDRLASTVEFLAQGESDPTAGSVALRRAVILQTTSQVAELDLGQVFDRTPVRRALGLAAAAAAIVLAVVALAPDSARIAVARLARPLGNDAWPKFYTVAFAQRPTRIAAGQTFEVELAQGPGVRLPDEVQIRYRYQNGPTVEETSEPMQLLRGTLVARQENVNRPFWYRAEGGDDQTPWVRLEVVEPPQVENLQVTLHPPAYSGLPNESSEKTILALRGTVVELTGSSTKKLRGASVHQEGAEDLPAQISADGYSFSLATDAVQPLIIDKSGPYWIVLEDIEGLSGGASQRWEIRAIADQPPTVTIERPAGNLFVTARGEVPLGIVAKDDLALHEIALHFNRSDRTDAEDFSLPLETGPERARPHESGTLLVGGDLGESRSLSHAWQLADLDLKPGTQMNFWATASDYLPQVGKSTVRRLTVVTPQEFEERLAQRQAAVLAELQRVLKLQQDARSQTKSLEIQIQEVGRLSRQDVDGAQAAELNQRQVTRTLTSPSEGIPAQVADLLIDLESNRVDSPDLERHMQGILAELERLQREHLGAIESGLTSAIKAAISGLGQNEQAAPAKSEPNPTVSAPLAKAGGHQDQVIASLENMLGQLGQWDNYRRFSRDIAQLQRDQENLARAAKELTGKTIGREAKDLDAQQQADLKKLASGQMELGRRLEKVQQQMAQSAAALKQSDPLSAGTISDGLQQAQQQGISGQMRKASEQIERNQLAQAGQQQSKIAKDLDELMAILANRREQELTRLVQQLRQAEGELARLRSQQEGLHKQMRAAGKESDPAERKRQLERLAREQKKLEEEAARLARKLERLQADQAGRNTASAASKMAQAAGADQQGDAESAQDQSERAEKDLEEAQQQLAERRRQAEEDLAHEQLARLQDSLKSLLERQAKALEETQLLEQAQAAKGQLTRGQRATLRELARQQAGLRSETEIMAEKLAVTEVIQLALSGAAKHMQRAEKLLEQAQTGAITQKTQDAARQRLAQLLTAFDHSMNQAAGEQGGSGGGGGGGQEGGTNYALAQLKLLRILQDDLNSRYRELTSESPRELPQNQLAELAVEQGRLAELALKLAAPPDTNPEDDPEKLPDVRRLAPLLPEVPGGLDELLEGEGREKF